MLLLYFPIWSDAAGKRPPNEEGPNIPMHFIRVISLLRLSLSMTVNANMKSKKKKKKKEKDFAILSFFFPDNYSLRRGWRQHANKVTTCFAFAPDLFCFLYNFLYEYSTALHQLIIGRTRYKRVRERKGFQLTSMSRLPAAKAAQVKYALAIRPTCSEDFLILSEPILVQRCSRVSVQLSCE